MIEILSMPFMQRALIAGVFLGALLALLGIFVVLKRMAFFSDGIAHASLAGVAIGVLAQINPLLVAVGFAAGIGIAISWLERKTRIATDAIIGLMFTSGMALGVILLALKKGYQPELVSFLFGNILSLAWNEIVIIMLFTVIISVFLMFQYKKIALMIINRDIAYVNGIPTARYETLLYVMIAVSVVLGIKLLGIVLVSALLIIPVSTAKLISRSFKQLMIWSIVISEMIVLLGMLISVLTNLPTGAVMVLCGTVIFFSIFLGQQVLGRITAHA